MNSQKPFSIVVKDFRDNLTRVINESGVPLELVYYIVQDVGEEVRNVSLKKLNDDLSAYNAQKGQNGTEEV